MTPDASAGSEPQPDPSASQPATSRRTVLFGSAGLSAMALAGTVGLTAASSGCSSNEGSRTGPSSASNAGQPLAKTSEIPVGGGKVIASAKAVLTQPTAGQFQAYSAVCTHEGCLVSDPAEGSIQCKCHGSAFGLDGSVKRGPAKKPLAPIKVSVSGDQIALA